MKKILITGKNSYVGINLAKWLGNFPDNYSIDAISLRDDSWTKKDFSKYDVVVHVAGIAHMKETRENASHYYKINRDLAYEIAQKAEGEGIKQLIFLSSMSVYGINTGVINKDTPFNPKTNYGKSKLQAEELITPLDNDLFKVAIVRPPMIYGKGCKGNYRRLANLVLKMPVFPDVENRRSMLYIDNLSQFLKILIDNNRKGTFFPQNNDYVNTTEMVRLIAIENKKKIRMTKVFNPIIRLLKFSIINKIFGDLIYEGFEQIEDSIAEKSLAITIAKSEKNN